MTLEGVGWEEVEEGEKGDMGDAVAWWVWEESFWLNGATSLPMLSHVCANNTKGLRPNSPCGDNEVQFG